MKICPPIFLIDSNLARGNPVIIRVRLFNGVTHFVVIVGKAGFDYLIQDPASGGANGVYPLRRLAREIEALRFYEKVTAPGSRRKQSASRPEMTKRNYALRCEACRYRSSNRRFIELS